MTISPSPDVYQISEKTNYGLGSDQCVSAAGHVYRTDKQGIIPELLDRFLSSRKVFKKQMKTIESEMERVRATNPDSPIDELKSQYNKLDALQNNAKLRANSLLYGPLIGDSQINFL